jgi:hypothetical protein
MPHLTVQAGFISIIHLSDELNWKLVVFKFGSVSFFMDDWMEKWFWFLHSNDVLPI